MTVTTKTYLPDQGTVNTVPVSWGPVRRGVATFLAFTFKMSYKAIFLDPEAREVFQQRKELGFPSHGHTEFHCPRRPLTSSW